MKKKRIEILSVPFDAVTYEQALEVIAGFIERNEKVHVTTPNPEMLVEASRNKPFLKVLQKSALALPDGIGILWAARVFHHQLPQRVTGIDLMQKMVEHSEKTGWTLFFLGAQEGVASIAAENLKRRYPQTHIVGTYAGSPSMEEADLIVDRINQAAPQILFVAYGSPAQEFWIARNLARLPTVRVAMGVGGAFDFMAGKIRRAPRLMQRLGLEWLWRLLREPWRCRRIWRATLTFSTLVLRKKFASKGF